VVDVDTTSHAFPDGIGLFKDFLEHEVGIATLFQLTETHLQFDDFVAFLHVVQIEDARFLAPLQAHHFVILQVDNPVGEFDDGGCVRSQEKFIVADAYNQGAGLAGGHNGVGIVVFHHGNGIGAYNLGQRQLNGVKQIDVIGLTYIFDKLHQYFSVRVALKCETSSHQVRFEYGIILNNTVVNHSDGL